MYLCQTAYYSTPSVALDDDTVQSILGVSRETNADLNITGALFYNGTRFIQVLEGERTALSKLLIKIAGDPRHTDFVILGFRPINERLFSSWSMTYISQSTINDYIMKRFSVDKSLLPEAMTYESVVQMMFASSS
jgi:redox-sensitive bicupin YhaK (pirin superfamily)